jgi:hypothetical protein
MQVPLRIKVAEAPGTHPAIDEHLSGLPRVGPISGGLRRRTDEYLAVDVGRDRPAGRRR